MTEPSTPPSFVHLLNAWNELEPDMIRSHLERGVAADVEFVDPNYAIRGIDAFEQMVREFRAQAPEAECIRTSVIDMHHDRARYSWTVIVNAETRVDGFDAVQLNQAGLVCRVDGFFGPLTPL